MTTIDDIIIKPKNTHVFYEKQGSLFWTYSYKSSDNVKLRSKEECRWHYILCKNGIVHTYEPNLKKTRYRPDFGIACNFLLEVCGMVEMPQFREDDKDRRKSYKSKMADKRKTFNRLGFNIIEVYPKELVINQHTIRDIDILPFVINVIKEHNPDSYLCCPEEITFQKL